MPLRKLLPSWLRSTQHRATPTPQPVFCNGAAEQSTPFFILGCVRSGTTMLRDILRMHPRLEGPEESHFFRWADPFGTPRYSFVYRNNGDLRQSRELDGITDEEFLPLLESATSRRDLQDKYCTLYLHKQNNPQGRWFDKTPQNCYGLFLLQEAYPHATFIHIHRNPLNVAASLRTGKVMPVMSAIAAANYWKDSAIMLRNFSKVYPDNVYTIAYEEFTHAPETTLYNLLTHLGEDPQLLHLPANYVYPERNNYAKRLTQEEQHTVLTMCEKEMRDLGYSCP